MSNRKLIAHKAKHISAGVTIFNGTVTILSSSGLISSVTGEGIMSGSSVGGAHTIYLGISGSDTTATKYSGLVGHIIGPAYPASGSTFTALPQAVFQSEALAASGTVTFALYNPSGSVSAGTITHTAGTPSANVTVPFALFVRDTSVTRG